MNTSNPKPAPMANNGHIAILIATRARPEMLAEVFNSLLANTTRKEQVSLWLYVDRDDERTQAAIPTLPDPGFPVHWHIAEQTANLGDTQRALWEASGKRAAIYMVSVDDARFDTKGWDEIVRNKFAEFSDGILLAFPHDPMTADTATYPIFSAGWLNTLEYLFPGYFPYWFDDRWVSQVGQLAGRCAKLPIILYPIRGKGRTRRMRNLPFWTRFFQLTLPERKAAASKLISVTYPTEGSERAAVLSKLEEMAAVFAKEQETYSDVYCLFQEERHTDVSPEERQRFDAKYFSREAHAVERLIVLAEDYLAKKEYARAMDCLDATQLSDLRVKQAQQLKVQCLRLLGRSSEAAQLESETVAAWPENSGLRRLFRFVGMVANDGKRLIVGLTHKGKKTPQAH